MTATPAPPDQAGARTERLSSGRECWRAGCGRRRRGKAATGEDRQARRNRPSDRNRRQQIKQRRRGREHRCAERGKIAQCAGEAGVVIMPGMVGHGRCGGRGVMGTGMMGVVGRVIRPMCHGHGHGHGHRHRQRLGSGRGFDKCRQSGRNARTGHQQRLAGARVADHPAMRHRPLQHRCQSGKHHKQAGKRAMDRRHDARAIRPGQQGGKGAFRPTALSGC